MRRLLTERAKDRIAAVVIRGGGVLVILAVVAIVVNIGLQALPLFLGASSTELPGLDTAAEPVVVGSDGRQQLPWELDRDGVIRFPVSESRQPLMPFGEPVRLVAADAALGQRLVALSADGRAAVGRVRLLDRWTDGERRVHATWRADAAILELPTDTEWTGITANADSEGSIVLAAWGSAGPPLLFRSPWDDDGWEPVGSLPVGPVRTVAVADTLETVAVVDHGGALAVFEKPRFVPRFRPLEVRELNEGVERIRYLIGGGTLVACTADGGVHVVLTVPHVEVRNAGATPLHVDRFTIAPGDTVVIPDDEVGRRLASNPSAELGRAPSVVRTVRTLDPMEAQPTAIAPSPRRRGFLVGTDDGHVALYHATSGRRLLEERVATVPITALSMTPKADGLIAAAGNTIARRAIDNPHPEISLRTLLLPVWYEGYARPKLVWQSTGGTDSFEPKLSLIPLIWGTLKATLFAMLISVPLAVLSALYVSQLGPPWLRSFVKPTIELMAAVPSVVVGFLAALWLAPRLEHALLGGLAAVLALPVAVGLAWLVWKLTPASVRRRLGGGTDLALMIVCGGIVLAGVAVLADPLEQALFGGDLGRWLFTELGLRYDQRNALVVGIALGFAVIPVIFTIAEDAFSSVPPSLVNASRALGATRWQTAVKLVAPAASAGVFAAIILGLGRAVGETMIVLMAAGNTPVLDLTPFTGMRTMSAAIAVEIPEAPVGGTLFRVLFLTGFLLFVFTLVLTTLADQVGRVLRKRYGRF